MTPRDILLAILVAATYGVAFVAIKFAVVELPPLLATGYRFLFAAIPAVFVLRRPGAAWGWVILYGLVQGVVMFGLLFVAISWGMPGGLASLLAQMQVFFTIVMAAWLFREIPRPIQIAGGLVALLGVGVIAAGKGETTALVPFLMIIAAAAAWGVANIIVKQARPTDMVGFVVWSSLMAPLPLFALSSALEGTTFGLPAAVPSLTAILSVLFLAWPTTVFAFGAWVTLLRRYPAATVTPFALLIPVFGFASTSVVFGEQLPAWVWAGSGLVFVGLGIIVMGPRLAASAIRLR